MTKQNPLLWGLVVLVGIMLAMPTAPSVPVKAPTASLPLRGALDPFAFPDIVPSGAILRERGRIGAPPGWVNLCRRQPEVCEVIPSLPLPIPWTAENREVFLRVNGFVNTTIDPLEDKEHWGVSERWDIPTDGKGDCEDYVLLKRKMLMEEGFAASSLLITEVKDEEGNGHAVLTVITDQGEFLLDNLRKEIVSWDAVGYTPVRRQSRLDPRLWVAVQRLRPLAQK